MYLHGNWLVPFYEGQPDMWNTKPPLLIWLQVISMKLLGVSDLAIRLPSAMGAVATGILLWWFCAVKQKRPWAGFFAGVVFASTYAYISNHGGRTGDYDPLLIFFMTFYCLSFFLYLTENSRRWLLLFWIFLTLATFTKGIVGLMLLPGIFLLTFTEKKFRHTLLNPVFYYGLLFFIFMVGGYYFLREQFNPGYLKAVYQNELGGRYLETLEGHQYPFGFYTRNMRFERYVYWFWFIIPAFIAGFLNRSSCTRKISLFNLCMTVPFWLIISLGQTKLDWYDLPLYPFLSLQIGLLIAILLQLLREYFFPRKNKLGWSVLFFLLLFFYPCYRVYKGIFRYKENEDVVHHQPGYFLKYASRHKIDLDRYVVCFEGYNGQVNFYIQQHQLRGSQVRLQSDVSSLEPGSYAVVNQPALKEQIEQQYSLKKVNELYGCAVYLVQARL